MYKEPLKVSGEMPNKMSTSDSCDYTAWWIAEDTKVGFVFIKVAGSDTASFQIVYSKK